MKDPINAADNKIIIKPEVIDDQENDTKADQANSNENSDTKPSIEVIAPTNVKEEIPDVEVKLENDSGKQTEDNNVVQETDILHLESDNINMDTMATGDSVKTEPETKIKPETTTSSGDAKPEATGQEEKSDNSKMNIKIPKRKRCRPRVRPSKRARYAKREADSMSQPMGEVENINSPEEKILTDDVEYCLTVTNLPNRWSFMDIKNYIDTQCGPVDEIEMLKNDKTSNGAIRLLYQTEDDCEKAMEKLKDKDIEGTKLCVSMSVVDLLDSELLVDNSGPSNKDNPSPTPESSQIQQNDTTPTTDRPWRPDLDMWEIDPKGTYGLKESFLKSLDITPPLDKWVHVSNASSSTIPTLRRTIFSPKCDGVSLSPYTGLQCAPCVCVAVGEVWVLYYTSASLLRGKFRSDKSDLRDALEMAGRVVLCAVYSTPPKYARAMYEHPLEAAQAVSMLNGKNFYGQPIKVVMSQSPVNTVLLAKGLSEVGTGLGAYGKPCRNITQHYYRYVNNQTASINREAFEELPTPNENVVEDEEFEVRKVDDFDNVVPNNDARKTSTVVGSKPVVEATGTNSINPKMESKPINNTPKTNVAKSQTPKPLISTPTRSPMQQGPQNFQPRNGPNFGQYGPRPEPMWSGHGPEPIWSGHGPDPRMQRSFGPGPGPRQCWNGPGPMGPIGQMQGPRPMGPMGGHMQGPMQGSMQGPMQGPIQGPMSGAMQGPMSGPMPGPMQGPMSGPMSGPMMQGSMSGPMQGPMQMMGPMQGPMGQGYNANQPVQLHLSNLPPSTSFALLCDKMARCGQIVSIQLSTPGAAVVTFASRDQADRCFQMYNNTCVEGCVIQVTYT